MTFNYGKRILVAAGATAALVLGGAPAATADPANKDSDILLVHGFGSSCEKLQDLKRYFEEDRDHSGAVKTVGYYGDESCDVPLPSASKDTPIQNIAADFAKYVFDNYNDQQPVNIVAHSMGGLVTRVAQLGSAQGWSEPANFPDKAQLNVANVVTLATPHQGISDPDKNDDGQWQQMTPGSGFMKRLHEDNLDEEWFGDTDWTLVGSGEDETVSYDSAIDKANPADKKFGYPASDDDVSVSHSNIREIDHGSFKLRYWHPGHPMHETTDGWFPLETAYEAATHKDDNLPR